MKSVPKACNEVVITLQYNLTGFYVVKATYCPHYPKSLKSVSHFCRIVLCFTTQILHYYNALTIHAFTFFSLWIIEDIDGKI